VYQKNPNFWGASQIQVDELQYPAVKDNAVVQEKLLTEQVDWGGFFAPDLDSTFVAKDPAHNHYWMSSVAFSNITGFAIAPGFIVSGQLLTEIVFSYPGIGFVLLSAVQGRDYALVQGVFLLITLVVLAANFLVDIVYVVLDPRVRQGGA